MWDRGCTKNKRKSKKALQKEYEELYQGTPFDLDFRLAQVVVIVWHTFQFSVGMPIFFIISIFNLTGMYWVDKYLLLRLNKTPNNMDEKPINHALQMMYWVFYMHFVVGYSMITNDSIINSDETYQGKSLSETSNINFFDQSRYNSYHAQVFFILNAILMIASYVVVNS